MGKLRDLHRMLLTEMFADTFVTWLHEQFMNGEFDKSFSLVMKNKRNAWMKPLGDIYKRWSELPASERTKCELVTRLLVPTDNASKHMFSYAQRADIKSEFDLCFEPDITDDDLNAAEVRVARALDDLSTQQLQDLIINFNFSNLKFAIKGRTYIHYYLNSVREAKLDGNHVEDNPSIHKVWDEYASFMRREYTRAALKNDVEKLLEQIAKEKSTVQWNIEEAATAVYDTLRQFTTHQLAALRHLVLGSANDNLRRWTFLFDKFNNFPDASFIQKCISFWKHEIYATSTQQKQIITECLRLFNELAETLKQRINRIKTGELTDEEMGVIDDLTKLVKLWIQHNDVLTYSNTELYLLPSTIQKVVSEEIANGQTFDADALKTAVLNLSLNSGKLPDDVPENLNKVVAMADNQILITTAVSNPKTLSQLKKLTAFTTKIPENISLYDFEDAFSELRAGEQYSWSKIVYDLTNEHVLPDEWDEEPHVWRGIMNRTVELYAKESDSHQETIVDDIIRLVEAHIKKMNVELKKVKSDVPIDKRKTAPFQAYAFADQRPGKAPFEKNTEIETKVYRALYDHVRENIPITKDACNVLKDVLSKGWYTDIIAPPTNAYVYRGMTVPDEWLKKALKLKSDVKLPKVGKKKAAFTFSPTRGESSSWSDSIDAASIYGRASSHGSLYAVMLIAAPNKNTNSMLRCTGKLYNVEGLDRYSEEREVIGLGDIKVTAITWKAFGDEAGSPKVPDEFGEKALKPKSSSSSKKTKK